MTDSKLEEKLGYSFRNRDFLENALTHTSFANESKSRLKNNERLEFLGDAVLSLVISDYLYKNLKKHPEGDLSKIRAALVCEKSLSELALTLDLGESLKLGKGEAASGGRQRPSILADAMEAVFAAIYLDGGMRKAGDVILNLMGKLISNHEYEPFRDYKTLLQEIVQQNPEERLEYRLVGEEGPDHDKTFVVEIMLNSNVFSVGRGKSKKQAEQAAAREALILLGHER